MLGGMCICTCLYVHMHAYFYMYIHIMYILHVFNLYISYNVHMYYVCSRIPLLFIKICFDHFESRYKRAMILGDPVYNIYSLKRNIFYFDSILYSTGCSLNILIFSEDLKIFQTLTFLYFPSMSVCVHTPGR